MPTVWCLAGCGSTADTSASRAAAILGGEASGPEDDGVVALFGTSEAGVGYFCSGALVAPNLVVTAASCISVQQTARPYSCTPDGELENDGNGAGELGNSFPPERIEVSVGPERAEPVALGQTIFGTGTTIVCRNDLAFVILDRSVENVPILPVRLSGAVQRGDSVATIGYGLNDENSVTTRLRADANEVLDVGVPPRTFTIGPGPCFGDFGGPALSTETGAVVGVLSITYGDCRGELARSVYTELAPFAELALRAFEAAGAEPSLEDVSEPGSPDGTTNTDSEGGCVFGPSPGSSGGWVSIATLALVLRRSRRHRLNESSRSSSG